MLTQLSVDGAQHLPMLGCRTFAWVPTALKWACDARHHAVSLAGDVKTSATSGRRLGNCIRTDLLVPCPRLFSQRGGAFFDPSILRRNRAAHKSFNAPPTPALGAAPGRPRLAPSWMGVVFRYGSRVPVDGLFRSESLARGTTRFVGVARTSGPTKASPT